MARLGRSLMQAIKEVEKPLPINKKFLQDVMKAIEKKDVASGYAPSEWYTPSGLTCIRSMYYKRLKYPEDKRPAQYNVIGMADTGTRRHDAIQEVLLWMNENDSEWIYIDVADYVEAKQKEGKCLSVIVKDRVGAETKLFDTLLKISYRCDGIMLHKPTDKYYLFEFKNQISFKYNGKEAVDKEHHNQVVCYCSSLDLDAALVLYENRDMLELECPELFEVTPEMKSKLVNFLFECESYVEDLIVPPKPEDVKCTWCKYKPQCKKDGK